MHTEASPVELEVLLPVHNEAESIATTLEEIYQAVLPVTTMRFILSEDGSTDGTQKVLERLTEKYPIKLISGMKRKGYSRAVLDGLQVVEAPYVLCLDGDGQCDPADFTRFWAVRERADVLIGWRVNRQDVRLRRLLSGLFKLYYRILLKVVVRDPSCPFVLAPRHVIQELVPELGVLSQGFWWEFVAHVWLHGYSIEEIPITHRMRKAGQTQVYHLHKLPAIGLTHARGLLQIWQNVRQSQIDARDEEIRWQP